MRRFWLNLRLLHGLILGLAVALIGQVFYHVLEPGREVIAHLMALPHNSFPKWKQIGNKPVISKTSLLVPMGVAAYLSALCESVIPTTMAVTQSV